jgi:YhfZ C-terminal domain/Helix-turn-helix domain
MLEELLSKHGYVSLKIARLLIGMSIGDRIPRISDFAERFNTGRGTVQAALKLMEEQGAIKLESRGHKGTFIVSMDFMKLWNLTGMPTIMGTMPLPYSKRYEGLATGLYQVFEEKGIPFHLAYMRGASNRLYGLLKHRYDFVIMSRFAAEKKIKENKEIAIAHSFGPGSYSSAHVLLFSQRENSNSIEDGMRVGVDPDSIDQMELTQFACRGKNVKFIHLPYSQILTKLQAGEIDTCVFNSDEIKDRYLNIKQVPIKETLLTESTEAVIVIRAEDIEIYNNLFKQIELDKVKNIQYEVLNGKITPRY